MVESSRKLSRFGCDGAGTITEVRTPPGPGQRGQRGSPMRHVRRAPRGWEAIATDNAGSKIMMTDPF